MPTFKVYQIEPMGTAAVPLLITTAYTNPGGYFKAEYFLAIPDDDPYFKAERFRINEKTFDSKAAVLNEDFMLRLALQRARLALLAFARTASKKHDVALYPRNPELLETDRELLLNYWMTGAVSDHLVKIGRETEIEELRDYIEWILTLPDVDKRDL